MSRPRGELEFELGAKNALYTLLDSQSKLVYIGEADDLVKRQLQPHPSIPNWDFFRYSVWPESLRPYRVAGARLLYEYDFGDDWQHELLLEEVLLGDESFQQMCVAGERCCPPEDCGGPQGFAEMLAAVRDANHPSHEDVCAWLGDFDPETFSADEINRLLRRRRKP